MSPCSVGDGDEDEPGMRHSRDQFFSDAKLGRVDEVVVGIDPEDGCRDSAQLWLRVVVTRGIDSRGNRWRRCER